MNQILYLSHTTDCQLAESVEDNREAERETEAQRFLRAVDDDGISKGTQKDAGVDGQTGVDGLPASQSRRGQIPLSDCGLQK